jgi:hypothetical protein
MFNSLFSKVMHWIDDGVHVLILVAGVCFVSWSAIEAIA